MDSDKRASSLDGVDVKVEFRKPSNDSTNRKYRRRSPASGSSSSDESPRREHGKSTAPARGDPVKCSDDHRGRSVHRDYKNYDSRDIQYGRSDHHYSRGSHHRHDEHIRSGKYGGDGRDRFKSTLRSRQDYTDGNHHDHIMKETESSKSRDHVHDVDNHKKIESDELELRIKDSEVDKIPIEQKTNKDDDSLSYRVGSSRRLINRSVEDVRSGEQDNYRGSNDYDDDVRRSYYKEDRDSRIEKKSYHKGDKNDRHGRADYYKGGKKDEWDEKSDYYKGVRDSGDEKREYLKGNRDSRNERRDYYKGDRDGRDDKREYYKGSRDGLDEKKDQRSLGLHITNRVPNYEEVKGHKKGLASPTDGSLHNMKEAKERDGQMYIKNKYDDDDEGEKRLKEQDSVELVNKHVSSSKGHESPAKKQKLFGMSGNDDHAEDVSKLLGEPRTKKSLIQDQTQETAGKVTFQQSSVMDSDIDAAKVAAMKVAEMVNKNIVGTGYLSTDQKKKLLWGNKKISSAEESAHHWDTTMFPDRERQEKFNKLMSLRLRWYLWPIVGCEGGFEIRAESQQFRWEWSSPIGEAERTSAGLGKAVHSWSSSKGWPHCWSRSLKNNLTLVICLYLDLLQCFEFTGTQTFSPCFSICRLKSISSCFLALNVLLWWLSIWDIHVDVIRIKLAYSYGASLSGIWEG